MTRTPSLARDDLIRCLTDFVERQAREADLRKAFDLQPKYTLSRDTAAESLALQVGKLAGELQQMKP